MNGSATAQTDVAEIGLKNDSIGALELEGVVKIYNPNKPDQKAADDLWLRVEPGQFVTLLGPSGCGKTTALRMIAGFETPTDGDIKVDGESILTVPPNRRPMSMVFQSYALFPHLSVVDNVAFGLKNGGVTKQERERRVTQVMELMGIEQYRERFPHELSGGQQQRVALARAIVMEPKILLFDEPLSNLDAKLRTRMRHEIRALQQRLGITSIFVTHDQSEAMTMSDISVVMRDGKIQQIGAPKQIYHHPASIFVASFLGTANFVEVPVRTVAAGDQNSVTVELLGDSFSVPAHSDVKPGTQATMMIRSENLHVHAGDRQIPGTKTIEGTVSAAAFDGAIIRYEVDTVLGELHGEAKGTEELLAAGAKVVCDFDPQLAWLIAETGAKEQS